MGRGLLIHLLKRLRVIATTAVAAAAGLINIAIHRADHNRVVLAPGDDAPDFELTASDSRTYRLSAFRGHSAVVIAWFPKAFTGGCTAECESIGASRHVLTLGRVAESARVKLNGRELGVLFASPFAIETGPLRPKGNTLEVEVTNVSANRIRDLDRRGVEWKIFRDINFVGIDYKPFTASQWPVRESGLIGPVALQPVTNRDSPIARPIP